MPRGSGEKVDKCVRHQRFLQKLNLEDEKGYLPTYQAGKREEHLGIREGGST